MECASEPGGIAAGTEPRSRRAAVYQDRPAPPPPDGRAFLSPDLASPAARAPRGSSLPFARRPSLRRRLRARAAAGALVALALGFASWLHAAETTVSQFAAGATWSLHGETSPVPGGTYTYTITRTAGTEPDNEYAGFHVPSTSRSVAHSNLGSNPMSCGTGKYFCASFSPSTIPGLWNNLQGHHTIYTLINNNRTITATLTVTADTPIGTTIAFGAIESNGRPRSGGVLLTVSTKPPDPTPPTLVSATTKTLTIEWTHPGDGGSPLVRNYLHYRVQGTTEWSNWYAGETPVTRAAIGGLQANTAYDVRVSVTNARGSSEWVMGATAFSTRANTTATGAPTITGTAGVGQVLTASTTGIADADGLPATFSYQWVRVDADGTSNTVDIPAATDASYTLTAPDVGKKVKVRVSFTDDLETTETLTSDAYPSGGTVTAAATCPVPDFAGRRKIWTAVLTMGDFTTQGSPLRGYGRFPDAGGDGGGLDPAMFTIGLHEYAVEELAVDAIRLYFSLPLRAIWRTPATAALRLHVCNAPYDFSDSHYAWDGRSNVIPEHAWDTALDWSSVSTRTVHLSLPDNRSATGALGITGTAEVGQVLGVDVTGIEDEDGLYDVEYAYQWVRVDADGTSNEEDISGATAATYTLTADDAGKKVKVEVSFTDDFGSDEQRPSAPTATVTTAATAACAVPSLSGRNVIWTEAMTVAVDPDNAGVFGFESGSFGTLDDQTFTVGTNDYRTRLVSLMGNVLTFATTNYDLTAGEKDVLRLHVCAADLDFSAAGGPTGDHGYVFSTTGLSWSSGDTVTLRLSLPATATTQVMGVGVAPGDAHLVVTWTAVDTATGYTVQWRSGGEDYNTGDRQATVTPGSTTRHTIDSLTNGTAYTVRVIATRTGATDGPPSAEMTGTPVAPGVTVSTTALTVPEEDTTGDSYTVVLATQSTANVRVTVAGHAGTTVTPTPGTLTFTTMTWDTAQTVTVTAGHDADTADESVSLTHSATSPDSDYEGIPITSVAVAVTDNDTAQVMGVGVAPGDAHLVVTWTTVDTATGYTVQWRSGGEDYNTGDRQATVTPGSTTRHTIDSLTNGTAYTVRVIATRTGATDGPPSAEMTGTPTAEPVPVPALPMAGAIGLGLLLLGMGRRALRGRARGCQAAWLMAAGSDKRRSVNQPRPENNRVYGVFRRVDSLSPRGSSPRSRLE